jgi:hypothetical protein
MPLFWRNSGAIGGRSCEGSSTCVCLLVSRSSVHTRTDYDQQKRKKQQSASHYYSTSGEHLYSQSRHKSNGPVCTLRCGNTTFGFWAQHSRRIGLNASCGSCGFMCSNLLASIQYLHVPQRPSINNRPGIFGLGFRSLGNPCTLRLVALLAIFVTSVCWFFSRFFYHSKN